METTRSKTDDTAEKFDIVGTTLTIHNWLKHLPKEKKQILMTGGFSAVEIKRSNISSFFLELIGHIGSVKEIVFDSVDLLDVNFGGAESLKGENLTTLKLNNMSIEEIPAFIENCTALETLDMSNTALKEIKGSVLIENNFKNLKNLKELKLRNTHITGTFSLKSFENLETLDLSNTSVEAITEVPPSLQNLYLRRTRIKAMPELPKESGLLHLDLSRTRVVELKFPVNVGKNLRLLDIGRTWVKTVPDCLSSLKYLCLKELVLNDFSEELYKNVKRLGFTDDDGKWNAEEYPDPGKFLEKKKNRKVYLPRVRIKTMDVRFLTLPGKLHEAFFKDKDKVQAKDVQLVFCGQVDNENPTLLRDLLSITEAEYERLARLGVRYSDELTLENSDGEILLDNSCRVSFLELQDSPVCRAAHPIFSGDDSLYAVLLDAREIESINRTALWWARYIELYAPWSDIVFILHHTKSEDDLTFFDHTPAMRDIRDALRFHTLGVPEKLKGEEYHDALDKVRNKLAEVIKKAPCYTYKLPHRWHAARAHLRSLLGAYDKVSYSQYLSLFGDKNDDEAQKLAEALLPWFSHTNLCFPDLVKDSQPDTVLYSPARMMIGVDKALELARENQGKIERGELLDALWDAETPAEEPFDDNDVGVILKYLEEYGLCYKKEDCYISPLYLKLPEKEKWNEGFRNWLSRENRANAGAILTYVGEMQFISNTILSEILLKTLKLFETNEHQGTLHIRPLNDNELGKKKKDKKMKEPFESWYPMETDGAFFTVVYDPEDKSDPNKGRKIRIAVGRSLDLDAQLYISVYGEPKKKGKKPSEGNQEKLRTTLKACAAVVMQAVKDAYSTKAGYRKRLTYQFLARVRSRGKIAHIPLRELREYRDAGYVNVNIFISALEGNENICDLMNKYYIADHDPFPKDPPSEGYSWSIEWDKNHT